MHATFAPIKALLCPISPLRAGETTARLAGLLAAALIGLYTLTGAGAIMLAATPTMTVCSRRTQSRAITPCCSAIATDGCS